MILQLNISCKRGEYYRVSQKDELIARLKSKPTDFTIAELNSVMSKCGCTKSNRGKTSGSAIAYVHSDTGSICKVHSPHPQKEIKPYCIRLVIAFLEDAGEI